MTFKLVMAVDPGPHESALVLYDPSNETVVGMELANNSAIEYTISCHQKTPMVIEMVGHYGKKMPVGKTIFWTCIWIGRFWKTHGQCDLILRKTVAAHVGGSARANDSKIIQNICYRYGAVDIETAKGTKNAPGPLYGMKRDLWQALALAITYTEREDLDIMLPYTKAERKLEP